METCLVTGVTGQDGAYLVELLLKRGCSVWGSYRRTSSDNFWRLRELGVFGHQHLQLVECDLTDLGAVITMVEKVQPQKIFNLAAQSFVAVSFAQPHSTAQVTALGALNVLEAIRILDRKIKFYQASTSEMFGKVVEVPQSENTPFYPRSPYGVAKLYAHWITVNYRESYGIFASSGILFNHESPLRGKEFVTRKITDGVAKIKLGMLDSIELGNLDARRDWGFAGDYVDGMDRMLAASEPDTFVLATNRTTSIRDFLRMAFRHAEIEIDFIGAGPKEEAINLKTGSTVARVNPRFYRPAEVDLLIGDFSKAKRNLSWEPVMQLEELCGAMFSSDLRRNQVGSPF